MCLNFIFLWPYICYMDTITATFEAQRQRGKFTIIFFQRCIYYEFNLFVEVKRTQHSSFNHFKLIIWSTTFSCIKWPVVCPGGRNLKEVEVRQCCSSSLLKWPGREEILHTARNQSERGRAGGGRADSGRVKIFTPSQLWGMEVGAMCSGASLTVHEVTRYPQEPLQVRDQLSGSTSFQKLYFPWGVLQISQRLFLL